jgi:cell division septation protein DedD
MLSILRRDSLEQVVSIDAARPAPAPAVDAEPLPDQALEESTEFEIVLGRRQIASVLFVVTVSMVAFSAISYLAGKSEAPKMEASVVSPAPAVASQPEPAPPVSAQPARVEPVPAQPLAVEPPLFADPKSGALYLQLGAVEKGVAIIMTEGLRKRHFDAFVGPGPNDHIFRVLIGPLDPEAYKRAKNAVDELGLSTFARKYQQ